MSQFRAFLMQTRNYRGQRAPKVWKEDGVKYGLVTYYPRHPNHQDPPIEPTKLLMVHRVKPYKGNPYWHKNILDQLKLNDKLSDLTIVKNTPEMCALLWKVKHLIKITPINTPDRLPDEATCGTYLHENGDLLITPKVDPARENATKVFESNPKRLDRPTLNNELRMRWLRGWSPFQ